MSTRKHFVHCKTEVVCSETSRNYSSKGSNRQSVPIVVPSKGVKLKVLMRATLSSVSLNGEPARTSRRKFQKVQAVRMDEVSGFSIAGLMQSRPGAAQ